MQLRPAAFTLLACGLAAAVWAAFAAAAPAARIAAQPTHSAAASALRQRNAPTATAETAPASPKAPWPAVLTLQARAEPAGDGSFTLTLEAWQDGAGPGPDSAARLCYTLSTALQADLQTAPHVYLLEKTRTGWGSVKLALPEDAVHYDPETGTLAVTGFDYAAHPVTEKPALDETGHTTYGRKLVVRLDGVRPAYARSYGGQGVPVGGGGLYDAEGTQGAAFLPTAVDLPLRCACNPADQRLAAGEAVNFGYMLRPPGAAGLPDGINNAQCRVRYTVADAAGVIAAYTVEAGEPMGAGRWTTPPPVQRLAAGETRTYTVTLTLEAARTAAGEPNPAAERLVVQSTATATAG